LWTYINPDKKKSGIADELIYENHLLARLAKSRKKEPLQTDSPQKKAYEEMNKLYEAMYKNDTELEQLQVASYKQKLNEKIGKIYKNQVSRFINDIEASSTDEN
jgi:hypothetical protein